MANENQTLEIWKKSRESIEHFDRLLGDFRKTSFAINGVGLTIIGSIIISQVQNKSFFIALLGVVLNVLNFVVWIVEKHYHNYLIVSAKVARKAEDDLKVADDLKLTYQLSKTKLKIPFFESLINYYDLIYIVPAFLFLLACFMPGSIFFFLVFLLIATSEILTIIAILKTQHNVERSS